MGIKQIDATDNFDELINQDLCLVDFYADWCGPCKMMGIVLEEIQNEIPIIKVNTDNFEDLATKYGVMSIPTLIFFASGKEKDKIIGFKSKDELLAKINEYKS